MMARVMIFLAIFLLVVLPSAIRTLGIYSGEFWRLQQYMGGDKFVHFIVGACLMAAFIGISGSFSSLKKSVWMFILACLILIIEELFQILVPGRHFEWIDMFYGLSGTAIVFLACLIFVLITKIRLKN